jgi:phosphoribosyl 1,2-cyclic phosphodiesterase
MFPELNLPQAPLRISKSGQQYLIWDEWRKKQVVLTPEEWVRQHLLHHLVKDLNYPSERLAVEMQIDVNGLKRRCDAVLFDIHGAPQVIIECKESEVHLNPEVVQQIAQYNSKLNARWLLISNGIQHGMLHIDAHSGTFIMHQQILSFNEIL